MDEYTKNLLIDILDKIILNIETNTNICIHEWIYDLIDIDPDKSETICYCCKCELTKS